MYQSTQSRYKREVRNQLNFNFFISLKLGAGNSQPMIYNKSKFQWASRISNQGNPSRMFYFNFLFFNRKPAATLGAYNKQLDLRRAKWDDSIPVSPEEALPCVASANNPSDCSQPEIFVFSPKRKREAVRLRWEKGRCVQYEICMAAVESNMKPRSRPNYSKTWKTQRWRRKARVWFQYPCTSSGSFKGLLTSFNNLCVHAVWVHFSSFPMSIKISPKRCDWSRILWT